MCDFSSSNLNFISYSNSPKQQQDARRADLSTLIRILRLCSMDIFFLLTTTIVYFRLVLRRRLARRRFSRSNSEISRSSLGFLARKVSQRRRCGHVSETKRRRRRRKRYKNNRNDNNINNNIKKNNWFLARCLIETLPALTLLTSRSMRPRAKALHGIQTSEYLNPNID